MSFGLPMHLAPGAISRALARACHAVAAAALTVAAIIVVMLQLEQPALILLPAVLALLPMVVALAGHEQRRSAASALAYLLIGAASTYWFVITLAGQYPAISSSAAFTIGQLKMALIMIAHGRTAWARLAWCSAGYVSGETAVLVAVAQAGGQLLFDLPTLAIFVAVATVSVVSGALPRPLERARPALHRALQDDAVAATKERAQTAVTALVHDTILGTFAAIAATPAGRISVSLRRQIERDLAQVAASELPADPAAAPERGTALREVIDDCRGLGLATELTGDLEPIEQLSAESASALAAAVRQCLVNVSRHADTREAQVAVYGGDTDVTVMVTDAGRGFTMAETPADRLGMRMSVHGRIAAVGGSTRVWSTPGRGTAVLIQVPRSFGRTAS